MSPHGRRGGAHESGLALTLRPSLRLSDPGYLNTSVISSRITCTSAWP